MTRYAIGLLAIFLLSASMSFAQSSPGSGSVVSPPRPGATCDDGIVRACAQAADELAAARKLLDAQAAQLRAADAALDAQKERVRLLAEQNGVLQAEVENLKTAVQAERNARMDVEKLADRYRLRIAELDAALAKAKRRAKQGALAAFLGGVAAGAAATR